MKTLKLGIFSGLLAATVLFGSSGAQTLAMAETQESAPANDLQSCAENIKRIYKERYPDNDDVIDEIVDILSADDEFIYIFENEGAKAFQIVEDSLRDALEPTPEPYYAVNGVYKLACTVPYVMQIEKYYCGPASVLQALIGAGYLTNESNNKNYAKQKDVADALETTEKEGTYVYKITEYMQEYYQNISSSKSYISKWFDSDTKGNVIGFLTYSLQNNGAPIVKVSDTSKFRYYNNVSQAHYVTVIEVDTNSRTITVMDPNYSPGLGNKHTITYNEMLELTEVRGGLWISVYANIGD